MRLEFREFLMQLINKNKYEYEKHRSNSTIRHSYLTTHMVNVEYPFILSKPLLNRNLNSLKMKIQTIASGVTIENVSYSMKTVGGYITVKDFLSIIEKEQSGLIDITAIEVDMDDTLVIYANINIKRDV